MTCALGYNGPRRQNTKKKEGGQSRRPTSSPAAQRRLFLQTGGPLATLSHALSNSQPHVQDNQVTPALARQPYWKGPPSRVSS